MLLRIASDHNTLVTRNECEYELPQSSLFQSQMHVAINSSVMAQVEYALYSMALRVCKDEVRFRIA